MWLGLEVGDVLACVRAGRRGGGMDWIGLNCIVGGKDERW